MGHLAVVRVLCGDLDTTVDCVDKSGCSSLWAAASRGLLSVLEVLHEHGGDVNRPNSELCTPLLAASQHSNLDTVTYLLTHGAVSHINTPNKDGLTPIWVAAHAGNIPLIHLLHDHGADVNQTNKAGESPVWVACLRSKFHALTFLYDRGADIDAPNHNGCTPLWMAAKSGNFDIVRALHVLGCDLDRCDKVRPSFHIGVLIDIYIL
jgi:uncharacterized protein